MTRLLISSLAVVVALGCSRNTPLGGSSSAKAAAATSNGASGAGGSTSSAPSSAAVNGSNGSTGVTSASGALASGTGSNGASGNAGNSVGVSGASSAGSTGSGTTGTATAGVGSTGSTASNGGLDAGLFQYCAGEGPPISVGDSLVDGGSTSICAGNLAQRTFRFALCTCTDLTIAHPTTVDSFANLPDGGTLTGRNNGALGADEGFQTQAKNSHLTLGGSLFVSDGGATFNGSAQVAGQLHVGSAVIDSAGSTIATDAFCSASVSGITIEGDLYVPNASLVSKSVTVGGKIIPTPVDVADPCDCTNLIDIDGIVASHAKDNDNASIGLVLDGGFADGGLDPATWASGTGPADVTFPCGRYYLTGVQIASTTTWRVQGRTAIMVNGDFTIGAGFSLDVPPGSELDLFIAGSLTINMPSQLGDLQSAPLTRVYVGGNSQIVLASPSGFYGNLYAPTAAVQVASPGGIFGSVFCKSFSATSPTNLHYDEEVLEAGQECQPPPVDAGPAVDAGSADAGPGVDAGPGPDAGPRPDAGPGVDAGPPDAGPPPPQCSSCLDCNNQACIGGQCTACQTSADCCAPLVCNAGVCQLQFR